MPSFVVRRRRLFHLVEKRVGSLYGASAEMAAILADDFGSERREALRKFGESIGVVKQLVADYQAIFGAGERDPVQQGRIISKKKNLATAFLFDTVKDPSVMRRAGEMYMQRVIDPSHISDLVDMAVEAGGREFNIEQIHKHLGKGEQTLANAGFEDQYVANLMELARDISDVRQLD